MFVLSWRMGDGPEIALDRLAASLASGTGRLCGSDHGKDWQAARLFSGASRLRSQPWHVVQHGCLIVLFSGWIANWQELSVKLSLQLPNCPQEDDFARLYACVVASRRHNPDLDLVGEYAAAVLNLEEGSLRLARSPICAPPLWFAQVGGHLIACNVPRPLFAAGLKAALDPLRLADNAWYNYNSDRGSWYKDVSKLGLGCECIVSATGIRSSKYYDLLDTKTIRYKDPQQYVEHAKILIDEAVKKCLNGFVKPGILLSGGLDSPIVAASAMSAMGSEASLQSFTFVPQSDWDGQSPPGTFGDDRPYVEAFAKLHPNLKTNFFDNQGRGFDYRLDDLFRVMGIAPINLANYSPFHMPFEAARDMGCDVLLVPEWGNSTFSAGGEWGAFEYFVAGRWFAMAQALRGLRKDNRSLWVQFARMCLLPLLPHWAWAMQRRVRRVPDIQSLASPLQSDFVDRLDLRTRSRTQGGGVGGKPLVSRKDWIGLCDTIAQDEANDIWQGFEQLYGVTKRDPAAYRPLVEYCLSLPTDAYVKGGTDRWLAREIARGILPEPQRTNRFHGRFHADWLAKLRPMRQMLGEELARLADIEELSESMDFQKIQAALANFPDVTPLDASGLPLQFALTRAVTQARFINFVDGKN